MNDPGRSAAEPTEVGLFATGGPFESFPGAVLVVGHNGIVLEANRLAEPIARMLKAGQSAELRDAIAVALSGKAAQVNPLLITERRGSAAQQAFDLVALPWADAPAALVLGRDITLERSLRAALIESRQRYKDLVEAASDFAWETDAEGRFTFISADHAMGYVASELIGHKVIDFLAVPDLSETSPFSTRVPVEQVEVWLRRGDGEMACYRVVALPLSDAGGHWIGVRGQCRDVTHERTRQSDVAQARHRERLFAHMLRFMRDELEPLRMLESMSAQLLPVLGAAGVVIYDYCGNGAFMPISGAGKALSEGTFGPLLARIAEGQVEAIEASDSERLIVVAARHMNDLKGALCIRQTAPLSSSIEDERFLIGEMAAQVGAVLKQLARERAMRHLSDTDGLTGLLNRRSFVERADQRMAEAAAAGDGVALLYIDLDNFKQLNDQHGHSQGDALLARFGALLRGNCEPDDLAVRFGGDEFGMLLASTATDTAMRRAELLMAEIVALSAQNLDIDVHVTASVGVALHGAACSEGLDELIKRADAAMYEAKRAGRNAIRCAPLVGDGES